MTERHKNFILPSSPALPQKYDRQIRIWGEQGQTALERASVCLINAGPTGTETLKNLVLPGIGSFTIIDGHDVTEADYGVNFFLSASNSPHSKPDDNPASRNRALRVMEAMHELNDVVDGAYIPQDVSSFIRSEEDAFSFFTRFSVVIITQMGSIDPTVQCISSACFRANVPVLLVRANGLVGFLRIQARELCILDAKEDAAAPDLRLHSPFKELEEFASKFNFKEIQDTTVLSHIPFVVILVQAIAQYRKQHGGRLPSSRPQKEEFKEIVKSIRPSCCPDAAENFEEALKGSNVRLCFASAREVPSSTRAVFCDAKSNPITLDGLQPESCYSSQLGRKGSFPEAIRYVKLSKGSSTTLAESASNIVQGGSTIAGAARIANDCSVFWLHVAAIRDFMERFGCLPLQGSLPDMAADTESYVSLQKLYSSKARDDARIVAQCASEIADRHAVDAEDFDWESVRLFCKNASSLRVYRTKSIVEEIESRGKGGFKAAAEMDGALDASQNGTAAPYYALLRAADQFRLEHGREAGSVTEMREADDGLICEYLSAVKEDIGIPGTALLWRDQATEMVRYAGSELHNVCAFMGGIAAQEVTKILTRQFMPLDNTLIVNFAQQTSVTFAA